MGKEDFFQELDKLAAESEAKKQSKDITQEMHTATVAAFVAEVTPKLEEYKRQLEDRGVRVEFSASSSSSFPNLSFRMYYSDGGHRGFEVHDREMRNTFRVVSLFTEQGKHYSAWGSGMKVEKEWTWEALKEFAEKQIKEFFSYADRYGGFKSK